MKKSILCLGLIAIFSLSSCEKKEKTTEVIETTTTNTDTVVVPAAEPAKTEGTTVKLDSSGVEVTTKKLEVEVKK